MAKTGKVDEDVFNGCAFHSLIITLYLINIFVFLAKLPSPHNEEGKYFFYLSLPFKIHIT